MIFTSVMIGGAPSPPAGRHSIDLVGEGRGGGGGGSHLTGVQNTHGLLQSVTVR